MSDNSICDDGVLIDEPVHTKPICRIQVLARIQNIRYVNASDDESPEKPQPLAPSPEIVDREK